MATETYILIAGAIGGLLKSVMESQGRVSLPKLEITSDGNYIHFGFLLNLVLGSIMAISAATDVSGAIAIGMSAAFVGEKIVEHTPIVKKTEG
jgi:hypothetical protein